MFCFVSMISYGQSEGGYQKFVLWTWDSDQKTGEYLRTPDWTPYGFSFWANGGERMYLYSDQLKVRVPINADANFRLAGAYSQSSNALFQVDAQNLPGGRLHVGINGNVGIGTANPGFKLDVSGDVRATTYTFPAPSGDPAPVITARTVPAGQGASYERTELILFHSNDNDTNGAGPDLITLRAPAIRLQTFADAGVNDINNASGSNDRLYIAPSGNVGIGTNAPHNLLDLGNSIGVNSADPNAKKLALYSGSGNDFYGLGTSPAQLDFYANAAPNSPAKMALTSEGKLGIGTTSPVDLLHVLGGSGVRGRAESSGTTYAGWLSKSSASEYFAGVSATGSDYQVYDNVGGANRFLIQSATGNVGIGTTTPMAALQVNDPDPSSRNGVVAYMTRPGIGDVGIGFAQTGVNSYSIIHLAGSGASGGGLGFFNSRWTGSVGRLDMMLDNNGNLLLGSGISRFQSNTLAGKKATYSLWVEKGVVAKDFAIADPSTWADFVFAPGYRLPALSETEHYIRQYGHLPEMPSEAEVKQNGYSVHEMNTRLLQKIEELTLHSIEQEKQIQQLTAMQAQLRQVEALATEVARLKVLLEK